MQEFEHFLLFFIKKDENFAQFYPYFGRKWLKNGQIYIFLAIFWFKTLVHTRYFNLFLAKLAPFLPIFAHFWAKIRQKSANLAKKRLKIAYNTAQEYSIFLLFWPKMALLEPFLTKKGGNAAIWSTRIRFCRGLPKVQDQARHSKKRIQYSPELRVHSTGARGSRRSLLPGEYVRVDHFSAPREPSRKAPWWAADPRNPTSSGCSGSARAQRALAPPIWGRKASSQPARSAGLRDRGSARPLRPPLRGGWELGWPENAPKIDIFMPFLANFCSILSKNSQKNGIKGGTKAHFTYINAQNTRVFYKNSNIFTQLLLLFAKKSLKYSKSL